VQGRRFGRFDFVVFGCRCRVGGSGVLTVVFGCRVGGSGVLTVVFGCRCRVGGSGVLTLWFLVAGAG
jgi:hypothetical protein